MTVPNWQSSSSGWISPCHQANRDLKKSALLEMANNYDIDGIHLDYHRANGELTLYEDSCRDRFQIETGVTVANWPGDVLVANSDLKAQYDQWRSSVITSFTKEIHDALIPINNHKRHLGKPVVILSAAVGSDLDYAKAQNAQDWEDWVTKGIIDVLYPMNYRDNVADFNELVRKQHIAIGNRIPFYPGIGVVSFKPSDISVAQIVATRGDNPSAITTGGFSLYNYNPDLAANYLPAFGQGVTSNITAQVSSPLLSQYFSFHENTDGDNLTSISQVNAFINGRTPDATFIATRFDYGNDTAFYNDLGHSTNLQNFLAGDAVSLSSDPGESSDAVIRIYADIPLAAGTYHLKVRGDDGYQVKVDSNVVALVDSIQAPTGTIHPSFVIAHSGTHRLEIIYWDQGGQAVFKAELSGDNGNSYKVLQTY